MNKEVKLTTVVTLGRKVFFKLIRGLALGEVGYNGEKYSVSLTIVTMSSSLKDHSIINDFEKYLELSNLKFSMRLKNKDIIEVYMTDKEALSVDICLGEYTVDQFILECCVLPISLGALERAAVGSTLKDLLFGELPESLEDNPLRKRLINQNVTNELTKELISARIDNFVNSFLKHEINIQWA